jgi:acyl carrier protein
MHLEIIQSKTRTIIAEQLKIAEHEIYDDSSLDNLGADNFDKIEIILQIEKAFNIIIITNDPQLFYSSHFTYLSKVIGTFIQVNQIQRRFS